MFVLERYICKYCYYFYCCYHHNNYYFYYYYYYYHYYYYYFNQHRFSKRQSLCWIVSLSNECGIDGEVYGPKFNPICMRLASYQIRKNCGLRMRREYRESFPHHRLQRKLLVSDPGMHHVTWVTLVPWFMSASLSCGGGENDPGIPGACATHNFTYLVRGPWNMENNYLNAIPWSSFMQQSKPIMYTKTTQ